MIDLTHCPHLTDRKEISKVLGLPVKRYFFNPVLFYFLQQEEVESPEIHFEPVIKLPEVEVKSLEEEEEDILKL